MFRFGKKKTLPTEVTVEDVYPVVAKTEVFEADPITTLDDILDGEEYARIHRNDWDNYKKALEDVSNRLKNVEEFVVDMEKKATKRSPKRKAVPKKKK